MAYACIDCATSFSLGHYQNEGGDEDSNVRLLYDDTAAAPLIASARILNAASESSTKELKLDDPFSDATPEESRALSWLAASAFASAGNFPSAAACLRTIDTASNVELRESPFLRIVYALLNPNDIAKVLQFAELRDLDSHFLEDLNALLATGDAKLHLALTAALPKIMRQCDAAFDSTLLRSARLALRHLNHLTTVKAVSEWSNLPDDKAVELGRNAPPTLLPAQWVILSEGFLKNRDNTLITLPTSTGKTLLAQLAILSDLISNGGIGIFVAPYVAVARQASDSLRKLAMGLGVVVSSVIDFADGEVPARCTQPQVFVVTPERLESLLDTNLQIEDIRIVVFDEAHLIENGVRGARLEGLLTRFRLRQRSGHNCRLILMSAVLENVAEVRDWLGVAGSRHHEGHWRPTARRIGLWEQTGQLTYVYGTDPVRPPNASALTPLGSRKIPFSEPMYATEKFPQMLMQWPLAYKNVAFLAEQLQSDIEGPVLIVCMTRGVAHALSLRFPEIDVGPEIQMLEDLIYAEEPHLSSLIRCLKHGIAYHNASLPPKIRAAIERALMAGELNVIASTTTLAEGADLPFRLTILYDWLQGFGENQRPMSPLLFRNIAGRAGRAGRYVEGDIVIFENVLGRERFTKRSSRGSAFYDLVSNSPKLRSSFEDASDLECRGISAAFESAFVAAIAENPNEIDLISQFSRCAFSSQIGYQREHSEPLRNARDKTLAGGIGGPIGIVASPISLTDFGRAVRATTLSPDSARIMLSNLPSLNDLSLDQLSAELLLKCGGFPEQSYERLRKLAASEKGRFIVKRSDLSELSRQWRMGVSLFEAFCVLPSTIKSKRKSYAEWTCGAYVPDWDAVYDSFLDFMELSFGTFVPLLARAALLLAPFATGKMRTDWRDVTRAFERRSDFDSSDVFREELSSAK